MLKILGLAILVFALNVAPGYWAERLRVCVLSLLASFITIVVPVTLVAAYLVPLGTLGECLFLSAVAIVSALAHAFGMALRNFREAMRQEARG